ncbi:hypothetical protein [Mycolicibacterium tusciae]|uniref:hypothetical protein n=1 Tax=Mycolicibacterium tusciae TaxID=75922 RepID=UPI00024A4B72|nr:hypothetical protein [Mycolicibacterium tusciae]
MAFGRRRRSTGISIRDLARFRIVNDKEKEAFDGRSVHIDEAARELGVSKKAVRDIIAAARADLSDKVFRSLTGRAEADTSQAATARGMLQAAFGRGPRGGPVDAKAAARDLGVSTGTVRRWAAGTQQPSESRLSALRAAARRSTTTKRGRQAAVDEFRNSAEGKAALQGGTTFWAFGYQGIPSPIDDSYSRDNRTMYQSVDAQSIEDMLRAYEERGADGFRDWLTGVGRDYMKGSNEWEFTDIYKLGFGERQ